MTVSDGSRAQWPDPPVLRSIKSRAPKSCSQMHFSVFHVRLSRLENDARCLDPFLDQLFDTHKLQVNFPSNSNSQSFMATRWERVLVGIVATLTKTSSYINLL